MSLRACIAVSLLGIGCGVGNDEPIDLEPKDPNPLGMVCTDGFKLTGSFTPGLPARDADSPTGCWPVGTWTFTATRDPGEDQILDITGDGKGDRCGEVSGTSAAAIDASYSFTLDRTTDELGYVDTLAMVGSTEVGGRMEWNGKVIARLKVSEGGGGECQGGIEIYSQDGKQYWNMTPSQAGTAITGFGEYALFEEPQN